MCSTEHEKARRQHQAMGGRGSAAAAAPRPQRYLYASRPAQTRHARRVPVASLSSDSDMARVCMFGPRNAPSCDVTISRFQCRVLRECSFRLRHLVRPPTRGDCCNCVARHVVSFGSAIRSPSSYLACVPRARTQASRCKVRTCTVQSRSISPDPNEHPRAWRRTQSRRLKRRPRRSRSPRRGTHIGEGSRPADQSAARVARSAPSRHASPARRGALGSSWLARTEHARIESRLRLRERLRPTPRQARTGERTR
ncbi:hypothetical protein OH76DRAFT_1031465 [Lentinus brumalis]|uniref:Uncharacterized protein n=1 Tax=Lentinus brumalis TaxID=2498619 RepID=A0A371CXF2_9APHY|nr:hypothetical protein OH76DRAFT_1031465 [Polyporus brumalis]